MAVKPLPRFTPEEGTKSRLARGYCCPITDDFLRRCEFISLGCYCAVSRAFVDLGVRQHAYPFDWARSSIEGVIHCFETEFEDFLTYTHTFQEHGLTCYAGARWGGSFWHHDIEKESVQVDIFRRVDRLIGFKEFSACQPRVFVRLLNSTRELDLVLKLKQVLQQCFPGAPIYLLVIVDLQEKDAPIGLEGVDGDGLLIYFLTSETVYTHVGSGAASDLQARSNAYAQLILSAAKIWASASADRLGLRLCSSMKEIASSCKQWYGGDTSRELYSPQYFRGRRAASGRKPTTSLPKLLHGKHAEFHLPETVTPGCLMEVKLFGTDMSFRMPDHAAAGMLMKCSLVEAVLNVALYSTVANAPIMAQWRITF